MKQGEESGHKTYILTCDLGEKLRLFRHLAKGIKTPDPRDTIFVELQTEIAAKIGSYIPDCKVLKITFQDLADEILSAAYEQRKHFTEAMVVSTCMDIAVPRRGLILEINRLIDVNGNLLGLGARPGNSSLNEQLDALKKMSENEPLILVEDGTFTGSTLLYLLEKFQEKKIELSAIVIGFAFPQAITNLKKKFDGEIITIKDLGDPIDWMPDHDFFPFSPSCGRVLGVSISGINYPFYDHRGNSYSIPYTLPFAPLDRWASIPQDKCREFSLFCHQAMIEIFEHLEKINKGEILVGDLMGTRPRVSIPISIGQQHFPRLSSRVTSFLYECCHELS